MANSFINETLGKAQVIIESAKVLEALIVAYREVEGIGDAALFIGTAIELRIERMFEMLE